MLQQYLERTFHSSITRLHIGIAVVWYWLLAYISNFSDHRIHGPCHNLHPDFYLPNLQDYSVRCKIWIQTGTELCHCYRQHLTRILDLDHWQHNAGRFEELEHSHSRKFHSFACIINLVYSQEAIEVEQIDHFGTNKCQNQFVNYNGEPQCKLHCFHIGLSRIVCSLDQVNWQRHNQSILQPRWELSNKHSFSIMIFNIHLKKTNHFDLSRRCFFHPIDSGLVSFNKSVALGSSACCFFHCVRYNKIRLV